MLDWPTGWPRTSQEDRDRGEFGKMVRPTRPDGTESYPRRVGLQWSDANRRVQDEVRRMKGSDLRIDTEPGDADPGVVVRFRLPGGRPVVMPCDRYRSKAQNLAAVAATLDAKRAVERHGVSSIEREFEGYAALPASVAAPPPLHDVLQVREDAGRDVYRAAFKAWVLRNHPDKGGDSVLFALVKAQYEARAEAP